MTCTWTVGHGIINIKYSPNLSMSLMQPQSNSQNFTSFLFLEIGKLILKFIKKIQKAKKSKVR